MKHSTLVSLTACALALALAGCASTSGNASQTAAAAVQQQTQAQRQAVGQGLYEIAYSPRQHALYVAAAGGFGVDAAKPEVLRLNPDTLAVQASIALERKGFGIALDDEAGRLYVGNARDASITVIDTASGTVTGIIQLAQQVTDKEGKTRYPHGFRELVLDKANHRLYAPGLDMRDSALYVVDTRTLQVQSVLPGFGAGATGITLDAAKGKLYVSNLQGQLFIVDTATLQVGKPIEIQADQPLNLVFDTKRQRLLATDQGMARITEMRKKQQPDFQSRGPGNRVVILDPANGNLLGSIPTGNGPVALMLDEARDRLYVTNREAGTVTIFDAGSHALLDTVSLPRHPNSLALEPKRGTVFVTVKNGRDAEKGSPESVARLQY